jgi:hypothetical protein
MNLISSSSPARVNNLMNVHKQLYKSPGGSANSGSNNASPSWRDAYKRRCFDEFKKSRQKLLTRFRNFDITDNKKQKENPANLKDYLAEELEKICLFQATSNEFISYDDAMEIYKQIQEELSTTEYYDYEKEVENMCRKNSDFSCICPICLKFDLKYLDNNNSCIFCSNCNFRINTTKSNNEKLTIECFADLLNNSVKIHNCVGVPVFQQITDDDGSKFLILICDACNYMKIII